MAIYEMNFIEAAYDMSTIARMTPQVFILLLTIFFDKFCILSGFDCYWYHGS